MRRLNLPAVEEIRGRGLLVGIELAEGGRSARECCAALLERGVLTKDTHEHIIRLAPPLVIEPQELEWLLERLEAVLGG